MFCIKDGQSERKSERMEFTNYLCKFKNKDDESSQQIKYNQYDDHDGNNKQVSVKAKVKKNIYKAKGIGRYIDSCSSQMSK